jgi:hypothetical protein
MREVATFLGLSMGQVKGLSQRGKLVKRFRGQYAYDQKDVNEFISRLNNGQVIVGRGKK